MNREANLEELGIKWRGKPNEWRLLPRDIIPYCNVKGEVYDISGILQYSLIPHKALGSGTFGHVDAFWKQYAKGEKELVAMKRTKHPRLDLLYEALFQWRLHNELKPYQLEICIPQVFSIFRLQQTGDICFTMKAFEPVLLSQWCVKHLNSKPHYFGLILLQIALVLEVFEKELKVDHRDLKINNMLMVDEPMTIEIYVGGVKRSIHFPFHIVLVDFGFACLQRLLDLRDGDGMPPLDPCPKVGRDIFQVLVSLWSIQTLRGFLEAAWGGWIRERIRSASDKTKSSCFVQLTEQSNALDWMYTTTDADDFNAPLCAPGKIIQDCLAALEKEGSL